MFGSGVEGDAAEHRDDREPAEPGPVPQSLRTKVELDVRIAVCRERSWSRSKRSCRAVALSSRYITHTQDVRRLNSVVQP